jgi:hypothetical protein
MKILFTICSNNYLAQALVLAASAKKFQPSWKFVLGLVDVKTEAISYDSFGFEVLEIAAIEPGIEGLAGKYSIVELNTCVKATYCKWFFDERGAEEVVYLDPDTCLYQPLNDLDGFFAEADILLTPHVLTPIPLDGRPIGENLFLNYGLYNLGFLALRRSEETARFLDWWKERTYANGYNRPGVGLYTDQLWINLVPVYFRRVALIRHPGYNMGPWNLHERELFREEGHFMLRGGLQLVFYHFSGFRPARGLLNTDERLYRMQHRQDLYPLYSEYKAALETAGHAIYSSLPCHYAMIHDKTVRMQAQQQQDLERRALPSLFVRGIRKMRRMIASGLHRSSFHAVKNLNR